MNESFDRADGDSRETEAQSIAVSATDLERRDVLTGMASTGAIVIAGCLSDDDEIPEETPNGESYAVVFIEEDERTDVDVGEDEALLYPALDAGVDIPYSCEAGRCGQCTAKYDGDANEVVEHDGNEYLDDAQIDDGWVLTCVAYPRNDMELEVAHPDDA